MYICRWIWCSMYCHTSQRKVQYSSGYRIGMGSRTDQRRQMIYINIPVCAGSWYYIFYVSTVFYLARTTRANSLTSYRYNFTPAFLCSEQFCFYLISKRFHEWVTCLRNITWNVCIHVLLWPILNWSFFYAISQCHLTRNILFLVPSYT